MGIASIISITFFSIWFLLSAILITATIIYQDDTARHLRAMSDRLEGKPDSYKQSLAMKILQKIPYLRHTPRKETHVRTKTHHAPDHGPQV